MFLNFGRWLVSTVSIIAVLSKMPFVQLGTITIGGGVSFEGGGAGTSPIVIGVEARTSSKTSVTNSNLVRPIATVDDIVVIMYSMRG